MLSCGSFLNYCPSRANSVAKLTLGYPRFNFPNRKEFVASGEGKANMIVSHRHRFIFLKSKKTAGTSVELALSAVCDAGDIITPLAQPEDEPLRRGLSPQNWQRRTLAANAQRKLAEILDHCTKRIDYYE